MAGDWIKLHRKLLDSAVFGDEWLLKLWIWCLLRAGYKERQAGQVTLQAGSFATGRFAAADELGVSPSKWYRGINQLASFGMIELSTSKDRTIVSVCNWLTYQSDSDVREQPVNSQWTAGEQPVNSARALLEEGKEGKEGILSPEGDSQPTASNNNGHVTPQEFVDRWNRKASSKGLPVIRTLTDERRRKLKTRLAKPKWFEIFVSAFQKLPLGGDWQPDFDWFIENGTNASKVAEGKYDWLLKKSGEQTVPSAPASFQDFAKACGGNPDEHDGSRTSEQS